MKKIKIKAPSAGELLAGVVIAIFMAFSVSVSLMDSGTQADAELGAALMSIVFFVGGFVMYFVPGIWAAIKKKKNAGAIALVNFFFGWTVIGWIVALIWAATND